MALIRWSTADTRDG